jgi:hypothetical protein
MSLRRSIMRLPSFPSSYSVSDSRSAFAHLLLLDLFTPFRAILQIRQSILSFHRLHPANSWSFTHKQMDHHSATLGRPPRLCIQGSTGGPCESRDNPILPFRAHMPNNVETTSIRRRPQFPSCQSAHPDRFFRLDKMEGYQSRRCHPARGRRLHPSRSYSSQFK